MEDNDVLAVEASHPFTMQVGRNDYYGMPLVRYPALTVFDPSPYPLGIHQIPVGELTLSAMVRLASGDHLPVLCHGALDRAKVRLPLFQRVTTSLQRGGPFVLFADPVLALDPRLGLAWFVGTATTDIVPAMLSVVERVRQIVGAAHVCFQGSSGGGFAALQLSAQVAGSLAYVWSPQTEIPSYWPKHVNRFLRVSFPGLSPTEALARFPERLSCLARYRGRPLANRIYFAQNIRDQFHIDRHFWPFLEVLGADPVGGSYCDGRLRVVEANQGPGHREPTRRLWRHHLESALAMLAQPSHDPVNDEYST